MGIKECTKCGILYLATAEYFYRHKQHSDGLTSRCKECLNKARHKHSKTHKIEATKYNKKYGQTLRGCLSSRLRRIRQRCDNPKDKSYKYYGGRGIKCLFKSLDEFVNHIVNELKIDPRSLTIDRIDNNGNYELGNIRLVTHKENCNNRRKRGQ